MAISSNPLAPPGSRRKTKRFPPPQNSTTFPRLAAASVGLLNSFRSSPRLIGGASGRKSLAAKIRFQGCCLLRIGRARFRTALGVRSNLNTVRMDGSSPRGKTNKQGRIVPYARAGAWSSERAPLIRPGHRQVPRPISNGSWRFKPRPLTRFGWMDRPVAERQTSEGGSFLTPVLAPGVRARATDPARPSAAPRDA